MKEHDDLIDFIYDFHVKYSKLSKRRKITILCMGGFAPYWNFYVNVQ